MKLSKESKTAMEKLHLLSGVKQSDLRTVLESLEALLIMNYLEGEATIIPFFGKVFIKHINDKVVDGKIQAEVEIDFEPDNALLRNIGQIKDEVRTDIEQMIERQITASLGQYLES